MKKRTENVIRKTMLIVMLFSILFTAAPRRAAAETGDPIAEAKNGIVEVVSGFSDKEGKFWQIKSGSGFLVSSTEGNAYFVTNNSIFRTSAEEKASYCSANGIEAEDFGLTDRICIVVKGDVMVEASVYTKSENMDFCVLSTENAVNEKIPLKLGDSNSLKTGDTVYALGFPKDTVSLDFETADVEIFQGSVQDKDANQSGIGYVQHSAIISEGNTGGPVIDEDGYVVGINCQEYANPASGRYYSLPVDELAEILDNFGIDYGSKKRDLLKEELGALRQECIQLNESKKYKKDSLTALQEALAEAEKLTPNPAIAEMELLYQQLSQAKDALVPKTEKILIAIYVFAALIVAVLILLIWILILNRRDKKPEEEKGGAVPMENEQPPVSSGAQPQTEKRSGGQAMEKSGAWMQEEEEKTIGLSSYIKTDAVAKEEENKFLQRTTDLELIRKSNRQTAAVDKPEYRIGKSPNQADLFISDNKAVSKRHASIHWKRDEYYACDLSSTNGTYLNGKKIPEGIPVKLSDGDTLRLADEEFTVRIFNR